MSSNDSRLKPPRKSDGNSRLGFGVRVRRADNHPNKTCDMAPGPLKPDHLQQNQTQQDPETLEHQKREREKDAEMEAGMEVAVEASKRQRLGEAAPSGATTVSSSPVLLPLPKSWATNAMTMQLSATVGPTLGGRAKEADEVEDEATRMLTII